MTRTDRLEMGLMAAVGTGIGLMLSHAMDWPWWVAIPLCVIAAGLCYRPQEIAERLREQFAPWAEPGFGQRLGHGIFMFVYWTFYVLTFWLVMAIIPGTLFTLVMMIDGSNMIAKDPAGAFVLSALMGTLVGGMLTMMGSTMGASVRQLQTRPNKYSKPAWGMPLNRRLHRRLMPSNRWFYRHWKTSLWSRISTATWKIPIAQLVGIYAIAFMLLDIALTIGMAMATTRRMAVMTCAFIGATVGTILGFFGAVNPAIAIGIGIGTGGVLGYYWYPLALLLKHNRWDVPRQPAISGGF